MSRVVSGDDDGIETGWVMMLQLVMTYWTPSRYDVSVGEDIMERRWVVILQLMTTWWMPNGSRRCNL